MPVEKASEAAQSEYFIEKFVKRTFRKRRMKLKESFNIETGPMLKLISKIAIDKNPALYSISWELENVFNLRELLDNHDTIKELEQLT